MKAISSIFELGFVTDSRILIFMPHPDDEAVFISGLLHHLHKNRIPTKVVTVTAGEKSTLRHGLTPEDDLAQMRRKELQNAFGLLGVTDYEILSFPDGSLKTEIAGLRTTVGKHLQVFRPTHVVTLEPDGIYGHPDHISLSAVVTESVTHPVRLLYVTIAGYKIKPEASRLAEKQLISPLKPHYHFKLGEQDTQVKIKTLKAHASQFKMSKRNSRDFHRLSTNGFLDNEYFTYREE